jgi:hypothetical protein
MICQECKKVLTEEDVYGHDCETPIIIMGIPLTRDQYLSFLRSTEREYGKAWNSIRRESRELMLKNHVQTNFPKETWLFN